MKNIKDIWLPNSEEYLLRFANKLDWNYQKNRLDLSMQFINNFEVCVDIGSHCGLWSKHLVKLFKHVYAFEPVLEHRECFIKNVRSDNYTLYPYALGDENKKVSMKTNNSSTMDTYVIPGNDVECKQLDAFDLKPDFIKIDTEGYEYYILLGAENTIKQHKPVIILEQQKVDIDSKLLTRHQLIPYAKKYVVNDSKTFALLAEWGYDLCGNIYEDYIFKFNKG